MAERSRSILICLAKTRSRSMLRLCAVSARDSVVIAGRQFCRTELERFRKPQPPASRLLWLAQEAPLFDEIADEIEGAEHSHSSIFVRRLAGRKMRRMPG